MTEFHRLSAFVLAALLLTLGGLLIAFVVLLPGPYSLTALDGEQFSFSPLNTLDILVTFALGLVLILGGIFLLAWELLGPPTRQQFPLQSSRAGSAAIDRQSVVQRLTDVLEALPGVVHARTVVRYERSRAAVDAELTTDPEIAVLPLSEQAQVALASTLSHDLGLQAGPLRVTIRHDRHDVVKSRAALGNR